MRTDPASTRRLRLWLCKFLLPKGYAIWTWNAGIYEDEPVTVNSEFGI